MRAQSDIKAATASSIKLQRLSKASSEVAWRQFSELSSCIRRGLPDGGHADTRESARVSAVATWSEWTWCSHLFLGLWKSRLGVRQFIHFRSFSSATEKASTSWSKRDGTRLLMPDLGNGSADIYNLHRRLCYQLYSGAYILKIQIAISEVS